jgi:hypothetical protein
MINSLLKQAVIDKCLVATVAGTSDTLTGDILDMQGFDSVMFIAILGDVTATSVLTLKAYAGNAAALGDGAYKTTTATYTAAAADADNKLIILDCVQIGNFRYVRPDLVRATANAVVDGIIAIRYNARNVPVTASADVIISGLSVN